MPDSVCIHQTQLRLCILLFLYVSLVSGQLGYSTYQNAMGANDPNVGTVYGGSGFSFNPEVGVVGPPGFGGGYEQLGVGQYPFVSPRMYWFLAGVSGSTRNNVDASVVVVASFLLFAGFAF